MNIKNTKIRTILFSGFLVITSLSLVACGGDGIGGTGITPDVAVEGTLARSSDTKLTDYFHDSIRERDTKNNSPTGSPSTQDGGFSLSSDIEQSSTTNIQEVGVDEADLIKTDGRYIYGIDKPISSSVIKNGSVSSSSEIAPDTGVAKSDIIRIMDTKHVDGFKEIQRISNDDANQKPWNIAGLYLHEAHKKLIALSSQKQNYHDNWFNSQYFANQKTEVLLIDVGAPAISKIDSTLHFEGQLIDSRRNGDTLYLVLRHYPDYQYINDKALATTTAKDFLPTYQISNNKGKAEKQLITQPENCYVEADQKGSADIVTLVAIDLSSDVKNADPQINSQCYVGSAEAVYASHDALYLATTRWDYQAQDGIASYNANVTTDIHKFNYDGLDFDYRGSGEVQGHLGYRQNSKSFRFSEHNDHLRIVTYDEDQWITISQLEGDVAQTAGGVASNKEAPKSPVSISILKENPSKKALQLVSTLPNKARPEPIGLPQEQLYATRFLGDKAYVVTFRVTDPLYVIDLSDPSDPFIAGELKVDGYSDYLHPVAESLLLGIGKDAIPAGAVGDGRGAWYQGVKLSLIDVADPTNPREVDKVIIGKRGTDSTVLYNHHALTSLKLGDKYQVAIPVKLHEEDSPNTNGADIATFFHAFKQTGLHRFEIDINTQKIITNSVLEVANAGSGPEIIRSIYNDRSVIIGENIYYMHDGKFWLQDWSGDNDAIGPK